MNLVSSVGLILLIMFPGQAYSEEDILEFLPAILTGIPEPQPPAPPSPPPADGVFIQNSTVQEDFFGDVLLVGEVFNNTDSKLDFVRVSANIFNGNSLVATDFTFTSTDIVPPRSRACFRMFTDYSGPFTAVRYEPVSYLLTADPIPNIRAINVSRSPDFFGDFRLLGQLRNNSGTTVDFAKVTATLYRNDGKVIDCDFTFPNNSTLSPGQSSGFEMFTSTPDSMVSNFSLQTDGNL